MATYNVVPLKLLAQEPFILLEEGHYHDPLEAFKKIPVTPHIKYILHDDYTIMAMVEAGLGVSILAELILHRTNYRIIRRPTSPCVTRTIAIAYKDRRALSMASQQFIASLQSHAAELP